MQSTPFHRPPPLLSRPLTASLPPVRLWTIHPRYLDGKGLVAAWREGLLAQKVLSGGTRGYRNHPQLIRFKAQPEPLRAIGAFLIELVKDAKQRGYNFDENRIIHPRCDGQIEETSGQLAYEWQHLRRKLQIRAPELCRKLHRIKSPTPHPLFRIVPGPVRPWEAMKASE